MVAQTELTFQGCLDYIRSLLLSLLSLLLSLLSLLSSRTFSHWYPTDDHSIDRRLSSKQIKRRTVLLLSTFVNVQYGMPNKTIPEETAG